MDAEKLRSTYNNYFSQEGNRWSSTDRKKTFRVAHKTLQWIRKSGSLQKHIKVLDVGCALGYYTESFRQCGCEATGLDYSDLAVQKATVEFPSCRFIQMNGFEPVFQEKFDLIFCRGFSGANTHDLTFIATWINKYMAHLSPDGFFVLGYSSDFSGIEKAGETVNLSHDELNELILKINGKFMGIHIFYYFGWLSQLKRMIEKMILRKRIKEYYYILFRKN
jgi:SAM-dependent methyltransferase